MNWKRLAVSAAFALTAIAEPAVAAPIVYTGYDVGSTSLAGSPNATAAAASFDAAAVPLSVIDFESGLPAGVGLSVSTIGLASTLCSTPALHCYATSGIRVAADNGASFTFANPIDAFGAYFTGWQVGGQTLTITYLGGSTTVLGMGTGDPAGGTRFFGFIDTGASIVGVTYGPGSDYVGLDDVRMRIALAIPEPVTVALLATGLVLAVRRRRD